MKEKFNKEADIKGVWRGASSFAAAIDILFNDP
jgi:hypothetical protein